MQQGNKEKKIGIDARVLMDSQYSGVSEYALNLIWHILKQNTKRDNYKIKLFYNSVKNVKDRLPEFGEFDVETVYLRYPNKVFNYLLQKSLKTPKLDNVLNTDVFFMPHINFARISGKRKSVLTIHDLSFLRYPRFFSARKNFWHKMLNLGDMVGQVDKVVAISENTKKDIVKMFGVEEERVKVIKSGINTDEFKIIEEQDVLNQIKQKYNLRGNFILYLGTLEPRKNVDGLIKAFDMFKKRYPKSGIKLIIAGGNGWKDKGIHKAWRSSENRADIKFIGYIPKEDKVYLYNLASLFVFPSFYEGFGLPPLEAMACGTPVVTGFTSSLPEVAGGSALLVDPFNIADISRGIEKALFNKNLRERMIVSGKERVKKFNWEDTASKYLDLINDL